MRQKVWERQDIRLVRVFNTPPSHEGTHRRVDILLVLTTLAVMLIVALVLWGIYTMPPTNDGGSTKSPPPPQPAEPAAPPAPSANTKLVAVVNHVTAAAVLTVMAIWPNIASFAVLSRNQM